MYLFIYGGYGRTFAASRIADVCDGLVIDDAGWDDCAALLADWTKHEKNYKAVIVVFDMKISDHDKMVRLTTSYIRHVSSWPVIIVGAKHGS